MVRGKVTRQRPQTAGFNFRDTRCYGFCLFYSAAPPVSSDGQLHVTMSPEAVYDNRTQQWGVQLKCGPLSSPGHPAVAVTWTVGYMY